MSELEAMLSLVVHSRGRCVELRTGYTHRAKMLRRFSSPHPERLRREAEALCTELSRFPDDD